jgi:uncharacterized RDD family membrane protein YckC
MTHDVFISYANEDKFIADAICANLEKDRIRCWVAPRDITPGTKFASSIIHAIDTTQLVVIVFSQHSDNSPYVRTEIERAFNHEKVIIPFRIENIEPSDEMQFFIGNRHWLDAMTPPLEDHINRLSRIVLNNLKSVGVEPEPPSAYKSMNEEKNQETKKTKSIGTIGRRFVAYFIDVVCGLLVGFGIDLFFTAIGTSVLGAVAFDKLVHISPGVNSPFGHMIVGLSLSLGIFLWIFAGDFFRQSQSPGKRFLDLEIGSDPDVIQPKSWKVLRVLVKSSAFILMIGCSFFFEPGGVITLTLFLQTVIAIPLLFTEKTKAVHDLVAGTIVYYNPK